MSRRPIEAASPTGWSKATHIFLSSSVHRLLQARILEWVSRPFSRGSSQLSNWTQASCMAGRFCTVSATRKALFPSILFKWRHWPSSLRLTPLASPETAPPSSSSLLMPSMHLNVYKSLLSLRNKPPQVHYFPPAPSTSLWSLSKLSFLNESSGFAPFQLTAKTTPISTFLPLKCICWIHLLPLFPGACNYWGASLALHSLHAKCLPWVKYALTFQR